MIAKVLRTIAMLGMLGTLAACGGGGAGGGAAGGGGAPAVPAAAKISLTTTSTNVKSDNSDFVTITATVQNAQNAVMAGQTVQFSASTGLILATTTTTDAGGNVSATFRSGSIDLHNRTAVITAMVPGGTASASIPIEITGSTLVTAVTNTSPQAGDPVTLTATAKIANGAAATGQTLRFSIAPSSTGAATLSTGSSTTNGVGAASVTVTGTAAGVVDVLVEWLDAAGNPTLSSTRSLSVQSSGGAFEITTPSSSPWPVTLGQTQQVIVSTPATIGGVTVANIRYATTLGAWQASGTKIHTVARSGPTDTQTFLAGNFSGTATVQIDALSNTGVVLATAKSVFALSASAITASSIDLQSNVTVLAPSSGGIIRTATLTAIVRDVANNAVGGASVLFELVNPTGSGEAIDPVVVSTNPQGIAQSTFTAGTVSTVQSSEIRASVIGAAIPLADTINITVGGTAGSVVLGTSTSITSINSDTSYRLPVTVMVTDSNGNAVSGATVSLSLWGVLYHKGHRSAVSPCVANITFTGTNEDVDENLILNEPPDLDLDGPRNPNGLAGPDGILWPPSSAVGSIPPTVTTGTDGTATFDWIYLKEYADWITARLRASVMVQGSEATTTAIIRLPASKPDVDACVLSPSPFN